jgi:hypothetical protein
MNIRQGAFAMAAGRPLRRVVCPEDTFREQVQNLRMAVPDLKAQVSDLAAMLGRE